MTTATTVQGDTWDILALRLLGSEVFVDKLLQANPSLRDTAVFSAGQTINVPDLPAASDDSSPLWRRSGNGSSGTTENKGANGAGAYEAELRQTREAVEALKAWIAGQLRGSVEAATQKLPFSGQAATAQRFVCEMAAPGYKVRSADDPQGRYFAGDVLPNNSTTQAIAVFNGDLYRSQDGKTAFNKYSFYNNVQLSRYPLGKERSRSSINYISNANAEAPEKTWVLLGCGHGDGFAFTERDGVPYFYAHASAPEYLGDISAPISDGSSDADIELNAQINDGAAGVIRIPWSELEDAETSKSSPYVPSVENGCVWYRYLPRVTNGNFGLSTDGKWMLFIDRMVTDDVRVVDRHTYTLTVTVFRRADVEAVPAGADGVADCSGVRPYSVFSLPLPDEEDTEYAESGITSDGVNVYLTFCGARIVSRCLIEVWTLEGQHVASVTTGTIRDETPAVFQQGVESLVTTVASTSETRTVTVESAQRQVPVTIETVTETEQSPRFGKASTWTKVLAADEDLETSGTRYRLFPFRYEVEGLAFWNGKLLTASRYLFAKTPVAEGGATALCTWNGESFVWSSAEDLWFINGAVILTSESFAASDIVTSSEITTEGTATVETTTATLTLDGTAVLQVVKTVTTPQGGTASSTEISTPVLGEGFSHSSIVPRCTNIAYWSPTSFQGGNGWSIPEWAATPTGADRLLFHRGETVFHHYVTAFTPTHGSAEEWGLDADVFKWPALRTELNPVVTRRALVWAYNCLNTHQTFPIMMADRNGALYLMNAMDVLNGLAEMYGAKIWVDGNTVSFGTTAGRSQYSVTFDEGTGRVNIYANGGLILSLAASALVTRGNLYPATHDANTLGRENNAWSNVFAKEITLDGAALSTVLSGLEARIAALEG